MAKMTLAALLGLVGGMSAGAAEDHVLPKPAVDLAVPKADETSRVAVFAGGCFWCTEGVFEQLDGVTSVVAGYAGDSKDKADYRVVCEGGTNHAEAIRITYDPRKITYGQLLQIHFATHDPTTLDRQGNDAGHQYRSAIFYQSEDEKKVAEAYIAQVNKAAIFSRPIVTTLEPIGVGFFEAETYHQNYVKLHPDDPYICNIAVPKVEKVRRLFPEQIKK